MNEPFVHWYYDSRLGDHVCLDCGMVLFESTPIPRLPPNPSIEDIVALTDLPFIDPALIELEAIAMQRAVHAHVCPTPAACGDRARHGLGP